MFKISDAMIAVTVLLGVACTQENDRPMTPANGTTDPNAMAAPSAGYSSDPTMPGSSAAPDIDNNSKQGNSPGHDNSSNNAGSGTTNNGSGNNTNGSNTNQPLPSGTGTGTGPGLGGGAAPGPGAGSSGR